MKQFGILLPSWINNQDRIATAKAAFDSIEATDTSQFNPKPTWLLMVKREGPFSASFEYPTESKNWKLRVMEDPYFLFQGPRRSADPVDQTLAWGMDYLFSEGMDYVTWMGNDCRVHPQWMNQLQGLIDRHPDAIEWAVYHSAYTAVHEIYKQEGEDLLVHSVGYGLTISKEEWKAWGLDWQAGCWPEGTTLDLQHCAVRPGERWCTDKSYIANTGRDGVHVKPWIPEYEVNFQNE